jgi:protein-histidine pros-kinase
MKEDRERCLSAGMDDYVSKPVRAEELLATIERVASRFSIEPRPAPSSDASVPVVNEGVLMAGVRGDAKLLEELVALFLEDSSSMLSDMKTAIENDDAAALASSAHAFVGSLGNFATPRAFRVARELERKAREGEIEEARGLFAELVEETARVEEALERIARRHGVRTT